MGRQTILEIFHNFVVCFQFLQISEVFKHGFTQKRVTKNFLQNPLFERHVCLTKVFNNKPNNGPCKCSTIPPRVPKASIQLHVRGASKPPNKLFGNGIICYYLFCDRCFSIFVPKFTLPIATIQLYLLLHMSASCCTFLAIVCAIFKITSPI